MVQTLNANKTLQILQKFRAEFLTCLQLVVIPVEMPASE